MTTKVPPPNTYFAIEHGNLSVHQLAGLFCMEARDAKTPFYQLESLSVIVVNATKFVRFRSDIPDASKVLLALRDKGHGVVLRMPDGFVFYRENLSGKVSSSLIAASPIRNPQSWRGPRIKYWERQFQTAS